MKFSYPDVLDLPHDVNGVPWRIDLKMLKANCLT